MATTPQAVSAALHRAGIATVPSGSPYEGVRVTRSYGGTASVSVGEVGRNAQAAIVEMITEALHKAGYTTEPNPHDAAILTVSK